MRGRLQLALILVVVGAVSWFAREAQHRRVEIPGRTAWITTDPDSLYQMRRVERALEEGTVAERDARLNWPSGSAIPWPPYYTRMVSAVLAPFAPGDAEQRHAWIETHVGSCGIVFGVLGSLLAAMAARRIAGDGAALLAGVLHALCGAAVAYGKSGNGDHHAFVSLLAGAMLLAATLAFEREALASRGRAWLLGGLLGVLAGLLLGVWTASLLYVLQLELALGALVVLHGREPRVGLPALGTGFHLAALAVVLPAVLSSPWQSEHPWIVVNLSWFHPAFLLAGAGVFAPLFVLRTGSRALRAWPWLVASVLALLGAWLALGSGVAARGVREGFAWVSRTDQFMARVGESRPLIGAGTGDDLFEALGYAALLLPLAWLAMLWRARACAELQLVPWIVAVPLLAAQALRQARFAEALALPMAVVLAWAAAQLVARERRRLARHVPAFTLVGLGLASAVAAQLPCARRSLERWRERNATVHERPALIATRMACEWLRRNSGDSDEAVLAIWSAGHAIEWAAGRPSVATNFGSYVGDDGFRASAQFLMSEDPDAALALLAARRARYVLVDSDLPNGLNTLIPLAAPELRERYVAAGTENGGEILPQWFRTLGARLMFDGAVFGPLGAEEGSLDRLRLVWVSPLSDPARRLRSPNDVSPAAWLWERVEGALIEARGAPGDVLEVDLRVRFPKASREITWRHRAVADASGVARLRVPYATDTPNGDGRVDGEAQWRFGSARGTLAVPEVAVLAGEIVRLE